MKTVPQSLVEMLNRPFTNEEERREFLILDIPPAYRDEVRQAWAQGRQVTIEKRYAGATVLIDGYLAVTELNPSRYVGRRSYDRRCPLSFKTCPPLIDL